jgi:hypothetical protein
MKQGRALVKTAQWGRRSHSPGEHHVFHVHQVRFKTRLHSSNANHAHLASLQICPVRYNAKYVMLGSINNEAVVLNVNVVELDFPVYHARYLAISVPLEHTDNW